MVVNRTPRDLVHGIQQNFARITVEIAREFIAEDCVIHEAPSLPFGGDWQGPQGFVDLMRAIGQSFEEFEFVPVSIVADAADTVAFRGRVRGRTVRGTFDMPLVEYWMCRNGKVIDILPMYHDTKAIADLFAA